MLNSLGQDQDQHSVRSDLGPNCLQRLNTVKPVLSGHSKMGKNKILLTNGSLMKVESIAAFYNTFDLH